MRIISNNNRGIYKFRFSEMWQLIWCIIHKHIKAARLTSTWIHSHTFQYWRHLKMLTSSEILMHMSNNYVSLFITFLFCQQTRSVFKQIICIIFFKNIIQIFQLHVYFPDWIPIDFYTTIYYDERFKEPLIVSAI